MAVSTQTITLAAVVLLLLILSFFIAGAEVAFFSLTYRDINMLKTKQDAGWKRITNLLEDPRTLFGALLVAGIVVNIAIIILSNMLIDQIFPEQFGILFFWILLKICLITFVLVLIAQVLPKLRAGQNNLRVAYEASYLVEIIYYLFRKLGASMMSMTERIEKAMGLSTTRAHYQQQLEEQIRSSVDEEEEQRILAGIYKFRHITVKQVMRTRLDVSGVSQNLSFKELKQRVEELHYSRLPVYKSSLDDIIGMVHTKDIIPQLNQPDNFEWHSLLRVPYFVHEQKFIEDLLKEFQAKRIHFAVVVDEFGGTSGIVTMEDVIEEIIGDIKDEFDEEESGNKKLDEFNYVFEGKTMINDVCRLMNISAETFNKVRGESDSLAGLVLELRGEIPKANDVVTAGDFQFTTMEVEKNRIRKVKVTIIKND
ncbi:MAG: gliding motility-associated protein GldE [Chitinophagaceae bacterium]|nr:MAG: gliding motility-associated protein GldE [Chitinophagaceae bacterium]